MRDVEVPDWIKGLPLAPEFCPTDTEFADPIAYISKIEKEASVFGICKIVPPVPKPSKKYVVNNLNKSLAKRPELGTASKPVDVCSTSSAVFTTRQQELGRNGKSAMNVVHKQVWQSGEVYTLDQFESKAKAFARGQLGDIKTVSPLVIETLFWEAACEKPIYVEYANDVPGSGFGEPTGLCRFLNNRRKRRTTFRRSCGGICANTSTIDSSEMVPNLSIKKEWRSSENGDEVDGSAGWKLSNSPWNLQVFSRSLGSLTRFMADDIPGVTSPMVYIGMLYSWFAWHVEDHELHSMNFLHTGSPKTWYAVPGKYAIPFEEVVRKQAYGAEVDRFRLVQNPGEFVVTFPRAYHVGFSHGFNCGEAANFGTPKWLEVAKEAAVRRAAMNCLPMLSHQQLLYLLTMSFVSRVPRSLLPGARSSRLRDRQKDERELSVKKAFLYDVLNENKLLTIVLSRSGSNRVVLWDLDSLPSFAKLPELCNTSDTNAAPEENVLSENKNNQDLLRDMNLYMENVDDFYMDNDDLSSDFQLFSGSLACVACGVLGFPFMSVVQPSVRASVNLMQDAGVLKHDRPDSPPVAYGIIDPVSDGVTDNTELGGSNLPYYSNGESSSGKSIKIMADSSVNLSTSHDPSPLEVSKDSQEPQVEKGWSSTKGFLRPRIFCLEHAVHIRDLLHSKGGANVLVICHSDFKKMEAHAAVIKEQVGSPFRYKEAPLDNATQCDLNLIDLAIDGEEHDESGKDWTSKLSINLQHCVKTRKTSPCKPDQHALTLGGLFSDTYSSANIFDLKWPLTKSRSKCIVKKSSELIKTGKPGLGNLSESMGREKGQFLVVKSDTDNIRNEHKVIQYSRRKFKCKAGDSMVKTDLAKQVHDEASVADTGDHNEHSSDIYSNSVVNIGSKGKESSGLGISASNGICKSTVYVMSQATCSVTPGGQNTQYSTCDDLEMQHESEVDRSTVETITFSAENFVCSAVVAAEDPQCTFIQKENKGLIDIEPSCCSDSFTAMSEAQREEIEVEKLSEYVEEGDCVEKQHNQDTNGDKENEWVPSTDTLTDRVSVVSKDASLEISKPDAVEESETQHEPEVDKGTDTILIFSAESSACSVVLAAEDPQRSIISPSCCSNSITTFSETQREEREVEKLSENVEGDCVEKQDIQGTNGDRENVRVLSTDTLTDRSSVVSKGASVEITKTDAVEAMHFHSSPDNAELENYGLTKICQKSNTKERRKRGREPDLQVDNPNDFDGYIRSPCEGLRPRSSKHTKIGGIDTCKVVKEKNASKASTKPSNNPLSLKDNTENVKGSHRCDIENQIDKEKPQSKISTKPSKSSLSRKDKKGIGKGSHMYGIVSKSVGEKPELIKSMKLSNGSHSRKDKKENKKRSHTCDLENCQMRFYTKDALKLHKSNKCPHKGCGKKFSSHVNTVRHQRVHIDDRPLKCPWKGCHKSFKWGWSRVEHMRLHTGERPYSCKIEGCDLTFRFISDFSRHRRKTGHYVNP